MMTLRFTSLDLFQTWPPVTQVGVHCSEPVDCDSLDSPQSLGPSSHRRGGNATPISEAAPCLSFGSRSRDLGNVDSA
jgi:hypothetical protein